MINSDFEDYYDKSFNILMPRTEFIRKHTDLSRRRELKILADKGVKVARCELGADIGNWDCIDVVVFIESNTHSDCYKKLVGKHRAYEYYKNSLCMEYIENDGKTYKYLRVGRRQFSIVSKVNEDHPISGNQEVLSITELAMSNEIVVDSPIYSIDYVMKNGDYTAIDYNQSQRLQGIINLKEKEIIEELEWYFSKIRDIRKEDM